VLHVADMRRAYDHCTFGRYICTHAHMYVRGSSLVDKILKMKGMLWLKSINSNHTLTFKIMSSSLFIRDVDAEEGLHEYLDVSLMSFGRYPLKANSRAQQKHQRPSDLCCMFALEPKCSIGGPVEGGSHQLCRF